ADQARLKFHQMESIIQERTAHLTETNQKLQNEIEAHQQAQEALLKKKHLEEAVQAMQQVLGVVSHELRTPLAALRATSEFLLTPQAKE
ncbi:MAG: hypothetical protein IID32_10580, partial [Planctomycetes bacterium]|nr:hypothetical protein [Planctomycetota bacterium]